MKWRSVSMREALLWARTREIRHEVVGGGAAQLSDRLIYIFFTDNTAIRAESQYWTSESCDGAEPPTFEIGEP